MSKRRYAALFALAAVVPFACDEMEFDVADGGENVQERRAGNTDEGVTLYNPNVVGGQRYNEDGERWVEGDEGESTVAEFYREIALDPSGQYFISRLGERLFMGNVQTGLADYLPGIVDPVRVAFDHKRPWIYYTTNAGDVHAYDVSQKTLVWTHQGDATSNFDFGDGWVVYPLISIGEREGHLVRTDRDRVTLLDPDTGASRHEVELAQLPVDVAFDRTEKRFLVAQEHEWVGEETITPETTILSIALDGTGERQIRVPNCADNMTVPETGDLIFMAPQRCIIPSRRGDSTNFDPISVIDLQANRFVRNLPGFGPVTASPDGRTVVGFLDLNAVDESLFDDPRDIPRGERFHMMFIDSTDLSFSFTEIGPELPRYTITPNGNLVLIDFPRSSDDFRLRVLDVATREIRTVVGTDARLHNFVMTRDSKRVYFVDRHVFELDLDTLRVNRVFLPFEVRAINLTSDDRFLLLRDPLDGINVWDLKSRHLIRRIALGKTVIPWTAETYTLDPKAGPNSVTAQLIDFDRPAAKTVDGEEGEEGDAVEEGDEKPIRWRADASR